MADNQILYFAAGYGCSNYGQTNSYNSCTPTTSQPSSNLVHTGVTIVLPAVLSIFLIVAAILIYKNVFKKSGSAN